MAILIRISYGCNSWRGRLIKALGSNFGCCIIAFIQIARFFQALFVEQGLTVCWFCVSLSVSLWVCVRLFLGLWLVENWGRRQTSYDIARLLLMVPIEPWRNSTPFFGAVAFCTTKIGDLKTTCPCRSHIQRLHYPAFATFLARATSLYVSLCQLVSPSVS